MNYCQSHQRLPLCDCDQNYYCPFCQEGSSTTPCQCDPTPLIKSISDEQHQKYMEEIFREHADIWERLARK